MKQLTTLEDYMNDRQNFEMAMQRVQSQNHRAGRKGVTFRQMTEQANQMLKEEFSRLQQKVAQEKAAEPASAPAPAPDSPGTLPSPPSVRSS